MSKKYKLLALVSLLFATVVINAMEQKPAEAAPPIPQRWVYYVVGRSESSFQTNINQIDIVSPNFYRLTREGTIAGSNRPELTNQARARGIKVIPMIQNDPVKNDFNAILD